MNVLSRVRACGAMLGAALIVAVMASTAAAQTVEEVIAKNIKAQGGKEALLGLKALQRKGDVKVDGTFGQMEGTIQEALIPWKKARRSLDLAVFVQDDGYDGKVAWRDGMMGLQELEGEEAVQIKLAIELNPFVRMAENELKAEKLADETVDGVDYYVVQLTPKERPPIKVFVNKKDDQINRTMVTQNHPQFGMIDILSEASAYEKFGPVTLATKNKVTLGELFQFETTYTETKTDGEIDESIFDMPKAAAADAPADDAKKDDAPKKDDK
ncbi:MAG: hypothetical protein AB7O59_18800 [Pirellulales bacterium]